MEHIDTIIAIVGAIVAAVVAIFNALGKKKYAGLVNAMWIALRNAGEHAASKNGNGEMSPPLFMSLEDGSDVQLRQYVHAIISEFQEANPAKRKTVGGNGAWNQAYAELPLEKHNPGLQP